MANNYNAAKDAIKKYLDNRAATDPLFAASYAKENKNLDDCFHYILSEARKLGTQVCMTDDEVFSLAVHYYDEDNIKVSTPPACRSSVSKSSSTPGVKLTEEEKVAAKAEAIKRYQAECMAEYVKEMKKTTVKKKPAPAAAPSLFDCI